MALFLHKITKQAALGCLIGLCMFTHAGSTAETKAELDAPSRIFGSQDVNIEVLINRDGEPDTAFSGKGILTAGPDTMRVHVRNGKATIAVHIQESTKLTLHSVDQSFKKASKEIQKWPGLLTLIPPLLAIGLAIWLHEVIISLLLGCFAGIYIYNGLSINAISKALFDLPGKYIPSVLTDTSNISVIIFSLLISGMVAIISANGGIKGIVNYISKFATNARKVRLMTWGSGIFVFFDDYANTLIVGNAMRPLTDKFRISREKLAYIVDSTAAPLAAIAFVTTWIGAQLGYIQDAIDTTGIEYGSYGVFINSLKYAYYPFFALMLVFLVSFYGKDIGSMYQAEKNVKDKKAENKVKWVSKATPKALNALIPILTLICVVTGGLIYTGMQATDQTITNMKLYDIAIIIGNSDAYTALLWGSFLSILVASVLSLINSSMGLKNLSGEMLRGFNQVMGAILILVLAWTLADISHELGTAIFLANVMKGVFPVLLLPAAIFVLSAVVAFATGSSWGTMAILYPLFLPVSYQLGIESGIGEEATMAIFFQIVAGVLGGSVFGDHCSPISDTTILSSMASGCDHMAHVKTQLPYALVGGVIALLAGYLMVNFAGLHWVLAYFSGFILLWVVIYLFGKR